LITFRQGDWDTTQSRILYRGATREAVLKEAIASIDPWLELTAARRGDSGIRGYIAAYGLMDASEGNAPLSGAWTKDTDANRLTVAFRRDGTYRLAIEEGDGGRLWTQHGRYQKENRPNPRIQAGTSVVAFNSEGQNFINDMNGLFYRKDRDTGQVLVNRYDNWDRNDVGGPFDRMEARSRMARSAETARASTIAAAPAPAAETKGSIVAAESTTDIKNQLSTYNRLRDDEEVRHGERSIRSPARQRLEEDMGRASPMNLVGNMGAVLVYQKLWGGRWEYVAYLIEGSRWRLMGQWRSKAELTAHLQRGIDALRLYQQ